ncbi:MAG: preprotein translocase subunit SecY [Candidatus Colwellbacteria bacterium RIFCSPLOWO2_12_FULL_44_13]|uniref:Protein translocase subunit SecY n=3 Tax=Candidatus Colwelliibacteriota TaxID=1817904 RepID=A0A1G1Z6Q6_9BACT|nr:MAG: preprotein translocase subunit SecY [Candidatus Colwellbacteria bacterium RIFCSPHIGHO2_12_FULL_44_17]OGY60305.1 MAG: preprotein translocase subunit SecY [Candidatus Colwellbacteria bacterium RIFCSPLOWO2_02_FULL_44_20b]OGY61510.1 MAG: preprotein translocase subunit SecY [Candidatus Colwellbacteria bacterium RIFCSPLOWO2_12_FULL_44_13]
MSGILRILKATELRNRILVVIFLLLVFRVFAAIPIPGVDLSSLESFFQNNQLLGLLNIFSGGALSNLSVAMLGVAPYITATIIFQLLTMIFPRLKEMYYEEGAAGRAKFNRYSRWLTVPLAIFQAYGFLKLLASQNVIIETGLGTTLINVLVITAGSMILMWIGEIITEKKIGNGISLIIFAGIVSGLPNIIQTSIASYQSGTLGIDAIVAFIIVSIIVIAGVVLINEGERKIPVSYAKRIRGDRMYGGVSSYLPLRINQAGVIPIIFAISILLFPQFIGQMALTVSDTIGTKINDFVQGFFNNQALYGLIYFILVFVFTYFYTAITFDPKEISKNLQRSGGFIPGVRPGEPTAAFLGSIVKRITFFGAIFLGLIAVLPTVTQILTNIQSLTIGGTALLIVVSVALETTKQVNAELAIRE